MTLAFGTGAALLALACSIGRSQDLATLLEKVPLVEKFDADKDGRLDEKERAKAREAIRERRKGRGNTWLGSAPVHEERDAPDVLPSSVPRFTKRKLYDPTILRTFFLYLPQEDWYGELSDFWRTDVELPGSLVVDGKLLKGVGVRFRGTSSYLLALRAAKKSMNISVDFTDPEQRLLGHRTINLLNAFGDTTLLREVLFSHVCREFVPTMRANFVRLVVNGEDWGVYANAQQFNTDFLADLFGSRKGVRWKVLRNSNGVGALRYLGDDPAKYKAYELKTGSDKQAHARLIRLCRVLNETPPTELPEALAPLLDVDGTLWLLALENVFMDGDGYVVQGYDYRLVEDKRGRFHAVPYDGNESMRAANTSPQARAFAQRRGQILLGTDASPLAQADNQERPLVHRLLAVPEWRARYLAHVRTLATEWLDWKRIGVVARRYHDLIDSVVEGDDRRGTTYEAFDKSLDDEVSFGRRRMRGLRSILEERRENLLAHESLQGAWPSLRSVEHEQLPVRDGARAVRVVARVASGVPVERCVLYTATKSNVPYRAVTMRRTDDGAWTARTAAFAGGTKLRFYVEARASRDVGRTTFHPAEAESGPLLVRVEAPR